ncbi:hypothetical protein B0H12DRAFT_457149 [Mycena haematopus]|nr:hypothetical protein B0H12DRAFT_457149 [Mycena haematopus]
MTESLSDDAIQQQIEIWRHLIFVPFTIVVYEYILTFQLEVSRYWGTGLTWGTAFFYLNRYSALFGTVPLLYGISLITTDPSQVGVCKGLQHYHEYFALLSQILVAVMLIMRTYALYERNKYVLASMVCVTLCVIGFALYILLRGTGRDTLDPRLKALALGCPAPTPHDMNIRTGAAWGGMLVFDVMIFLLTIYKALWYDRRRRNLFSVMFRDGSVYFGIMIAVNIGNIITYTQGGPIISGSGTTFVNVVSSVMLTRLMLNLRDPRILRLAQRTRRVTTTQDLPAITTLMDPYLDADIGLDSMPIDESEEDASIL